MSAKHRFHISNTKVSGTFFRMFSSWFYHAQQAKRHKIAKHKYPQAIVEPKLWCQIVPEKIFAWDWGFITNKQPDSNTRQITWIIFTIWAVNKKSTNQQTDSDNQKHLKIDKFSKCVHQSKLFFCNFLSGFHLKTAVQLLPMHDIFNEVLL